MVKDEVTAQKRLRTLNDWQKTEHGEALYLPCIGASKRNSISVLYTLRLGAGRYYQLNHDLGNQKK